MTKIYFVVPGNKDTTPGQVADWQDHLDKVAASHGIDWMAVILPPGSEIIEADTGGGETLMFPAGGRDLDACPE